MADTTTIAAAGLGVLSLANIAGVVYLVKIVIAPVVQSVKILTKNVEELFESRNNHQVRIAEIQTIHKLKGCDTPASERNGR